MSSYSGHRPFPVSDVHSVSWLFGKRLRDHSQPVAFFRPPSGIPLLKPTSLLRRYPWKMWYSCKAGSAFDLRLAAEMSSCDGTSEISDAARRRRRRSNTLLLVLAVGFLIFGAAAVALYYALQPVTLRIAVGPPGSDDHKVIQATAGAFASESSQAVSYHDRRRGRSPRPAWCWQGRSCGRSWRSDAGRRADRRHRA